MKSKGLKSLFLIVLLCFCGSVMYSQDKTQAYYSSHEREILPDAKAAFRACKYGKHA